PPELRPAVAGVDLVRLAVLAHDELVRVLLVPLDRLLRPVDLDEDVVLAAVADLAGGDGAERAVLVPHDRRAVVVERPPRLERLEDAGDLLRQKPGDVAAEVVGVRADVAEAPGRPGLLRVGPPLRLLLVVLL